MKNSWKFFITVELVLLIITLWSVSRYVPVLIFLGIAIVNLIYAIMKVHRSSFNQFQMIISLVIIFLCLFTTPFFWIMLIFGVLFIGLKGVEVSGVNILQDFPWKKKRITIVETTGIAAKNGRRFKRPWIGNDRIGVTAYEWDDINLTFFSGDTIVDLGNTLLPKTDNVIMVRKGFGRTRILVPYGIGVMVEHSTLMGNLVFEEEKLSMKNETIRVYSDDYDDNQRRLRICTSTIMGDLEVIRI